MSVFVLLDRCAASDTVDHIVVLERLENWVVITGIALDCPKSYLEDRNFVMLIGHYKALHYIS